MWTSDAEVFQSARCELFSAVLGDVMDTMGLQQQFLPPAIGPLERAMVVCGRAMTVEEADLGEDAEGAGNPRLARPFGSVLEQPFGLMMEALDDLKADEVYICSGASPRYALWGELMSVRAMQCGAAGAVVDGYSRDTRAVLALGFPMFSHGSYAQDQGPRGRVTDFRVPIQVGRARVTPGDVIFGDLDGVCVIPKEAQQDVFAAAFDKARKEKVVRKALEEGMSSREAFEKFGIL